MPVSTLSIQEFCQALYCTLARWEAFVPDDAQRIAFTALDTARGERLLYRVEFIDIRDFRWQEDNESPRAAAMPRQFPDQRLELSEVELEREAEGWRFWCNPWYCRTIEFRCAAIRLNGVAVSGSGKWLQDSLPDVNPDIPPYGGEEADSVETILDLPRAG
jgi:hypothetical protein